jgi:hypothetical protein
MRALIRRALGALPLLAASGAALADTVGAIPEPGVLELAGIGIAVAIALALRRK